MSAALSTISPVDGRVYVERPMATIDEIDQTLERAVQAQRGWKATPVDERAALLSELVKCFKREGNAISQELSWQMGRPISQAPAEVRGFEERANYMIGAAASALADIRLPSGAGLERFIRRQPLGVVFTVAPWNYPFLTAVNSVVPALMAGNAVVLKHSAQTPLCAERMVEAGKAAGLPEGVFQYLHLGHAHTARVIADQRTAFVAFTGSVQAGAEIEKAAVGRFIGVGLELGGKDPAYVRADANVQHAVEQLADGAFYNSGQSCCGIERIYVHGDVYDRFVEGIVEHVKRYRLGDPLDPITTLGPVARPSGVRHIEQQVREALRLGARELIHPSTYPRARAGSSYMAPQVLVDVDHRMSVMKEESFGPIVGVMKVSTDEEAIELMNDSPYGLTASIWTQDREEAIEVGESVETGTWFMNRCDYLDPALAWVGVKDSGRGCTLSRVGYEQLTRPMSFNLKASP